MTNKSASCLSRIDLLLSFAYKNQIEQRHSFVFKSYLKHQQVLNVFTEKHSIYINIYIYVNDLPKSLTSLRKLFADDNAFSPIFSKTINRNFSY